MLDKNISTSIFKVLLIHIRLKNTKFITYYKPIALPLKRHIDTLNEKATFTRIYIFYAWRPVTNANTTATVSGFV